MSNIIRIIPVANLALAFIPVAIVLIIMYRWSIGYRRGIYAVTRMLLQLILIGYVLTYIFAAENAAIVVLVLCVMLAASSWIAMTPVVEKDRRLYLYTLLAVSIGGVSTLALITQAVLALNPWFLPRYLIPLAGMIFANSMNAISLAAERQESELRNHMEYEEARHTALKAALIPQINALFAVGLVSLPGMMTGQILSGVSPLIAIRYQIMVMCMIFGAAGISASSYLYLHGRFYRQHQAGG